MKTSTEIGSAAKTVGYQKAVAYVAKAGFDAFDFSLFDLHRKEHGMSYHDWLCLAKELKQIGLDHGIVCNQSHAPFPVRDKAVRDSLKYAIECTAEAGGNICVIHPNNHLSAKENAPMFLELLTFAKEHGVRIATENMWTWDDQKDQAAPAACSDPESFCAHLNEVNDPFLVACLDIGHAEMRGLSTSAVDMIHALGSHLAALHIHDNDLWHDSHQIPFSMQIDFRAIVRALKEINYQGYFTLESDCYLKGWAAGDIPRGLCEMAQAAKRLADMFEKA